MVQYHEVKINIDFEQLPNLLKFGSGTSFGSGSTQVSSDITDCSLWVDYIFLDTDERRRFAQLSHEYLIEQLQYTGDESLTGTNERVKLNFNHPVKELIWVVQRDSMLTAGGSNNWNNYAADGASGSYGTVNPIVSAKLQLNGQDRFAERPGTYFNLVQPFQHHENVPSNVGINVYSFALKPEEHQPSGTLNFSRVDTAVLQLSLNPAITASSATGTLKTYATGYNVLRVMSGINCLSQIVSCQLRYYASQLGKQYKHSQRYNWLVVLYNSALQQTQIAGNFPKAFATTSTWKHIEGIQGNDLGHSKNAKDVQWTIRSQASAVQIASNRMKVQRTDGFGSERFANLFDLLRYVPAVRETLQTFNQVLGRTCVQQLIVQFVHSQKYTYITFYNVFVMYNTFSCQWSNISTSF
jgi:hypothetical protein